MLAHCRSGTREARGKDVFKVATGKDANPGSRSQQNYQK